MYLWTCGHSKDSDQPAHLHNLIRIMHILNSHGCKVPSCGLDKNPDKTAWTCRLIHLCWHTCKKVHYLNLKLLLMHFWSSQINLISMVFSINPSVPNGLLYLSLDRSIPKGRGVWLVLLLKYFIEIPIFNAMHSAACDLGLHCLPMSILWDARHKWVNPHFDADRSIFLSVYHPLGDWIHLVDFQPFFYQ